MHPPEPIRFAPFSTMHLAVVVVFITILIAVVALRRRLCQAGFQRVLDYTLALVALVAWILNNGWGLLSEKFDPVTSLPLHVCDITALVAVITLVRPARWLRAVLYFWGLGLSTQGFITPGVEAGPAEPGFWFFWANHFTVVGAAIYDVAARGYRPGWRDFFVATSLATGYVILILPIDIKYGLNYGYVGHVEEQQPSLLDYLPPWPLRVLVMVALGYAVMALLTLPWVLGRRAPLVPARGG